jgi:branched-subunit amino acid transport protein
MDIATFRAAADRIARRRGVQLAMRWARRVVAAAVLGWLCWQIAHIGLAEVARALPWNPLFYVLALSIYFLGPLGEIAFFAGCWGLPAGQGFLAFCRKRVYDQELFDGAGEIFLYNWARQYRGISQRDAFRGVKDNAILSALAANVVSFTLPAISVAFGLIDTSRFPDWLRSAVFIGPPVVLAALVLLVVIHRRIFGLPAPMLLAGFGIHCTRQMIWMVLASLQWRLAIGGESWRFVWTMIVVQQFSGRIPAMPFRDALFVAVGVGAAEGIDGPTAEVASVLLVNVLLEKLLNVTLYSTSVFRQGAPTHSLETPSAAAAGQVGADAVATCDGASAASRAA